MKLIDNLAFTTLYAAAMTFYVTFSADYNLQLPLEDMLSVEADSPQAAIEQALRDGNGPTDRRLRCVCVVSAIQNRKDRGSLFWISFDGEPKHFGGELVFWP